MLAAWNRGSLEKAKMPDHPQDHQLEAHTASFTHIIRALRAYLPVMALALAAVVIGYVLVAATAYILAPSTRVTSLQFRLDFEGAERGEYPNGMKFGGTEIIGTPILLKTFRDNDLGRFMSFADFATSVFVLQSNPAAEAIAREYQARLADIRLSAVDRERIQREYEMKLASVNKNEFSIQFVRKKRSDRLPETVALKTLNDILKNWSDFVTKEQHVLQYRVNVLSPDAVSGIGSATNPIIDAIMLRDKVLRLRDNVDRIRQLPAADLAQTSEGLTLGDLMMSMDDVVRYRLDPLITRAAGAGLDDRAETIRFLESQLATDERNLEEQDQKVAAIQATLGLYSNPKQNSGANAGGREGVGTALRQERPGDAESVMPQLSDTFIDRLLDLTNSAADVEYRRRLAEEYRTESLRVAPLRLAVSYDRALLDIVRGGRQADQIDGATAVRTIAATRQEIRGIALKVREIHRNVSSALNPSTQLLTINAPVSRVERGLSLKRLALYGLLVTLLSIPVITILALLHNHLKSEEDDERLALTTSR